MTFFNYVGLEPVRVDEAGFGSRILSVLFRTEFHESLRRGRVCLLYMLLALASLVFLGSESLGARDHIILSQI
jgi:hypothetical protein